MTTKAKAAKAAAKKAATKPVKTTKKPAAKTAPVKAAPEPKYVPVVADEETAGALADAGFNELCCQYRAACDVIAEAEITKKTLAAEIEPMMEAVEVDSVVNPDWTAVRARGKSVQLKREKLLQKGVSMAVIEACTVSKPYTYIQVVKPATQE